MAANQSRDNASPGASLRAARAQKNLTVAAVADALRTRETVIVALENDDYSVFSADMYARGFIRNYARVLEIDSGPLLALYQEGYSKNDPDVLVPAEGQIAPWGAPSALSGNLKTVLIGAVLAVLALVTVASVVLGGRAPETASVDDVQDVAPEPAPAEQPAQPESSQSEEPEPVEIDGVELVLIFEQASWMQILVDGVLVLEETVRAGETLQYRGDEIRIRFGNAGGVFAELNGEDLGIQGGRGEVIDLRYTRDGVDVS